MKASELRPGQSVKKVELLQAQAMVAIFCQDQEHADRVYEWSKAFVAAMDTEAVNPAPSTPEPFKAGDYLYCTNSYLSLTIRSGNVYKVLGVDEKGWPYFEEGDDEGGPTRFNKDLFRHATSEEIAAHKLSDTPEPFRAGDWVVCVDDSPTLSYGCVYQIAAVDGHAIELVDLANMLYRARLFRHATPAEIAAHKASKTPNALLADDAGKEELPKLQLQEGKYYERRDGKIVRSVKHCSKPAKYRPFANAEEFRIHRDRWLRYKHSAVTARVSWVRHDMVEIGKHAIYWRTLFHDYVFDDNGEPCGVREPQ